MRGLLVVAGVIVVLVLLLAVLVEPAQAHQARVDEYIHEVDEYIHEVDEYIHEVGSLPADHEHVGDGPA